MTYIHRVLFQLLILFLLVCPLHAMHAQEAEVAQEYQLKAAFLYNFARFITWPDHAFLTENSPINVCVVGENPFASILTRLEEKTVGSHPLKIHYIREVEVQDLMSCHMAFYNDTSTSQSVQDIKDGLVSTVFISDVEGFVPDKGDIEFVLQQRKLKFIINNSSMKEKGIQPRASLLELAAAVY